MDATCGVDHWTSLPTPDDVNLFLLPDYNDFNPQGRELIGKMQR